MGREDRQMTLRVRDTTTNLSADTNSCPISTAYMRIRRLDIDMNEQRFGTNPLPKYGHVKYEAHRIWDADPI